MPEAKGFNEAHFTLSVEGVDAPLRVLKFSGKEGISRLFRFEIFLESDAMDLDPADVVGQNVEFLISSRGYERTIKGIVCRFEHSGVERDVGLYELVLVPSQYLLSQNRRSRIFQNLSVVDILTQVLETADVASDLQLFIEGNYSPLEYCVQYRETDLDFFDRLCEQHGLFYFFDFSPNHMDFILCDRNVAFPDIHEGGGINYHGSGELTDYDDFISEFRLRRNLRPTKHVLRDYNFESPRLDLTQQASSSTSNDAEWYDYPGKYYSQGDGAIAATVRMEAEDRKRDNGAGLSNSVRLYPGAWFDLSDHPVERMNDKYLTIAVEHSGSQPSPDNLKVGELGYNNRFKLQLVSLPFRSFGYTARPTVTGSQTATVTGPSGHEIYCDKHGRVKVRFHWDRSDSADAESSCWVRVSQTWAGKGWGTVFIPRIGQEVILDFLEGDPDRPIITGSVYNGANLPPYALPDKQTVATIKSDSSIGSGGSNELRFEDAKGSEEVYLHSQKDLSMVTENNKTETVGANRSQTIDKDETLTIKGKRTKSVAKDEKNTIDGKRSTKVKKADDISVGAERTAVITKDETLKVGGDRTVSITGKDTLKIKGDTAVTISAKLSEKIDDVYELSIGKDFKVTVKKNVLYKSDSGIILEAKKALSLKCGKATLVLNKNGQIMIKGKNITVKGTGKIVIKGSKITQN